MSQKFDGEVLETLTEDGEIKVFLKNSNRWHVCY